MTAEQAEIQLTSILANPDESLVYRYVPRRLFTRIQSFVVVLGVFIFCWRDLVSVSGKGVCM